MSKETDTERYWRASHAMQTGVAADHGRGSPDGSPKHLRVGVNIALADQAGLVRLLIDKGLFTEAEYAKYIADEMEREVARYEEMLGPNVTLA